MAKAVVPWSYWQTCACTHYARWNLSHHSLLSAFLSALMHSVAYCELREHYGKRVAHVIRDQAGGPGRCCSQEIIIFISSIPEDPSFDWVLLSLPRLRRHWHELTSSSGRVMMITDISAGPSNKGYIQSFLYQIILFLVSNFSSMSWCATKRTRCYGNFIFKWPCYSHIHTLAPPRSRPYGRRDVMQQDIGVASPVMCLHTSTPNHNSVTLYMGLSWCAVSPSPDSESTRWSTGTILPSFRMNPVSPAVVFVGPYRH